MLKKQDFQTQKLITRSLETVRHLFNKHFPVARKLLWMLAELSGRLSKNGLALRRKGGKITSLFPNFQIEPNSSLTLPPTWF